MNDPQNCRECGAPLATGAPAGLCRACLLKMGLEPNTLASTDAAGLAQWQPPAPAELAGKFPDFEILELLGRGGMGAVYKARQKSLDRPVALKILPPEVGQSGGFTERFTREAQALARLNHPHIVTIYDFGQRDGLYFFAMEFVDGPSLRQLIDAKRVSPGEALTIVPQICDALQFAHDHGIVHRDIKPENILLNSKGQVKIADFGLAKLIGADAAADADRVLGTPQYMAPEQVTTPAEVDHRADIYSLGVVFYQLLTGELPDKFLAAPSTKVAIDVRLDEVVLRALEHDPSRRYQQVSEVKTRVETIANVPSQSDRAAPSESAAPIKSERGYYATPEFWATSFGGFWRNQGTGELTLFRNKLVFSAGLDRVEIPFSAVRQLGLARGPRWTNPAGHPYLSIDYDQARPRKLLYFPGGFRISLPGDSRARALEWLGAIRSAVRSQTGQEPPGQIEPPEIVPSSPWGSVLLFASVSGLFLLVFWFLSTQLTRGPNGQGLLPLIVISPGLLAIGSIACWFVILPVWSWYSGERPKYAASLAAGSLSELPTGSDQARSGLKKLLQMILLFALVMAPLGFALWYLAARVPMRVRPVAPRMVSRAAPHVSIAPRDSQYLFRPEIGSGLAVFRGSIASGAGGQLRSASNRREWNALTVGMARGSIWTLTIHPAGQT